MKKSWWCWLGFHRWTSQVEKVWDRWPHGGYWVGSDGGVITWHCEVCNKRAKTYF